MEALRKYKIQNKYCKRRQWVRRPRGKAKILKQCWSCAVGKEDVRGKWRTETKKFSCLKEGKIRMKRKKTYDSRGKGG